MTDCMFVDEWDCPVTYDEFPLEVCKICTKARSVHNNSTKIKVPKDGKSRDKNISQMIQDVRGKTEGDSPKNEQDDMDKKYSHEDLTKEFNEGKISVDEYIKKRKNLPAMPETKKSE